MPRLARRSWVPTEDHVLSIASAVDALPPAGVAARVEDLVTDNHRIHDLEAFNLNPATNVMNPRAEACCPPAWGPAPRWATPATSTRRGSRPSSRSRSSRPNSPRGSSTPTTPRSACASGAMANLYVFMAVCRPGDTIIAPPASIGGHVTHHAAGAAGLLPVSPRSPPRSTPPATRSTSTRCAALARDVRPRLITIGGSLNLTPHPVAEVRDDRRRGRRQGPLRRRPPVRPDRRRSMAEPARRGRAPDDDEHLQEPRRPARRARRHQATPSSPNGSTPSPTRG